jgi:hypothetical protein
MPVPKRDDFEKIGRAATPAKAGIHPAGSGIEKAGFRLRRNEKFPELPIFCAIIKNENFNIAAENLGRNQFS